MGTVFMVLFIILFAVLIVSFLRNLLFKRELEEQEELNPLSSSWMVPSVLQSLRTSDILSQDEFETLDGKSYEEVEEYVIQQDYFATRQEFLEWVMQQPDIMGAGDSVFGGIDRFDRKK
ncbi:OadG family protein [Bacillus horti]|uniref:Uncharacterized protein n=1 Tax=Caldalkalibacillus horti TaxID=77523 RepID=A0ABT9VUA3_9BACI|nr:OadG family protein [Bacillus horti]MDQ0164572.1 hypothetical protein [Bacillus horti]